MLSCFFSYRPDDLLDLESIWPDAKIAGQINNYKGFVNKKNLNCQIPLQIVKCEVKIYFFFFLILYVI